MVGLTVGASRDSTCLIVLIMATLGAFHGMSAIMMGSLGAKLEAEVIPITGLGFGSGWRNVLQVIAITVMVRLVPEPGNCGGNPCLPAHRDQ